MSKLNPSDYPCRCKCGKLLTFKNAAPHRYRCKFEQSNMVQRIKPVAEPRAYAQGKYEQHYSVGAA